MNRSSRTAPVSNLSPSIQIEAPPFQNWSCQGCAECCRGSLLIEISEAEKRTIEAQGWALSHGVDPDRMIEAQNGRLLLGHQNNGACVFLDGSGRCRIHAKFGEPAKPLACRIYPFVLHPAGRKLLVSLRFGCRAAAENHGRPLSEQAPEIRRLAELIVPASFKSVPPPVLRDERLDWEDFWRYVNWLDRTLSPPEAPAALKMARAVHWLKAIAKANFDQLTGAGADEILEALVGNAAEKLPALARGGAPSVFGRFCLRHLVLECGRAAKSDDARLASSYRWKKLWALLRFASGTGNVPPIGLETKPVRFAEVEKSFGPLPASAEAMLTRYLRVKIQGLQFCGPAHYGFSLVEGFYSLAVGFSAVMWLSRWRAAVEGRANVSESNIANAITMVDPYHGSAMGQTTQAWHRTIRLLAQRDDIARLCCWHAG